MKAKLALLVLTQAVKYLKNHPDLIPGHVDDAVIKILASAFGV